MSNTLKDIAIGAKCFELLKNAKYIVVGVSGGSDSVALLHYLYNLKSGPSAEFNFNIIAAHVNHLLRGDESFRDELFVEDFCKKLNIPLKILRVNIEKKAKQSKKGIEETARLVRYDFFYEIAKKNKNSLIATAHTLTDSIETTVLNLSRGTGLNGICGIPELRERIIRPFINLTKLDTINYCKVNKLSYIHDSSNNSLKYKRNLVRHKVLPILKEINPGFERALSRTFSILKEDSEYLDSLAEEELKKCKISNEIYNLNILKQLPSSLFTRCIRLIVLNFLKQNKNTSGFTLGYSYINLICGYIEKGCGTLTITKNIYVKIIDGKLIIFESNEDSIDSEKKLSSVPITELLTHPVNGFIIKVVDFNKFLKEYDFAAFSKNILDYGAIPRGCVLRNRRSGDVINLPFRNIKKTLKKFFNEEKVPLSKRNNLVLLAKGNEVLWLEDFGASENCFVKQGVTKKVLFIERRKDFINESIGR